MSEQAAATSQPITSNSNARPGELEVRPTVRPNAMTSQSDDQSGNDQQIDQRTVNENIVKTLNALNEKASSETGVAKLIADPIIRTRMEAST